MRNEIPTLAEICIGDQTMRLIDLPDDGAVALQRIHKDHHLQGNGLSLFERQLRQLESVFANLVGFS